MSFFIIISYLFNITSLISGFLLFLLFIYSCLLPLFISTSLFIEYTNLIVMNIITKISSLMRIILPIFSISFLPSLFYISYPCSLLIYNLSLGVSSLVRFQALGIMPVTVKHNIVFHWIVGFPVGFVGKFIIAHLH